jgi:hypothetical protein
MSNTRRRGNSAWLVNLPTSIPSVGGGNHIVSQNAARQLVRAIHDEVGWLKSGVLIVAQYAVTSELFLVAASRFYRRAGHQDELLSGRLTRHVKRIGAIIAGRGSPHDNVGANA